MALRCNSSPQADRLLESTLLCSRLSARRRRRFLIPHSASQTAEPGVDRSSVGESLGKRALAGVHRAFAPTGSETRSLLHRPWRREFRVVDSNPARASRIRRTSAGLSSAISISRRSITRVLSARGFKPSLSLARADSRSQASSRSAISAMDSAKAGVSGLWPVNSRK